MLCLVTVCFLNRWHQTKCKVLFDRCYQYSLQNAGYHVKENNKLYQQKQVSQVTLHLFRATQQCCVD